MVEVFAKMITKRKIFYDCPYCWTTKGGNIIYDTQYFKNGNIAQNRIPTVHSHGNDSQEIEMVEWEEYRGSHCTICNDSVCIKITENTERR